MTEKKPNKRINPKRIDKLRAVELKQKGASYSEIAAIQGVSPQAIQQGIKDLLPTEQVASFNDRKADIIDHTTMRYINLIDDAQIKKNLNQRGMTDIAILIDKSQLLKGLSTSNLAIIHADIAAIRSVDNSNTNNAK